MCLNNDDYSNSNNQTMFEQKNIQTREKLSIDWIPSETQGTRKKNCALFESSLLGGLKKIKTHGLLNEIKKLSSLCSFVAWKLELFIYKKFHSKRYYIYQSLNKGYIEKVNTIWNLLESNYMICAKVVIDKLSFVALIERTSEQHKCIRSEQCKEKLKIIIKTNIVISKEISVLTEDFKMSPSCNPTVAQLIWKGSTSENKRETIDSTPPKTVKEAKLNTISSSSIGSFKTELHTLFTGERYNDVHKVTRLNTDEENNIVPLLTAQNSSYDLQFSNDNCKMSISPSRNAMLHPTTSSISKRSPGYMIISSTGKSSFQININKLKLSFSASLFSDYCVNNSPSSSFNNLLPDSFNDKGRLPIEEFNNFISAKLATKRWELVSLRLVNICNGADAAAYKRFYKEYEQKRRIAIFDVPKGNLSFFLVTPKFINVANCLKDCISGKHKNSTHAVCLHRALPS